MSFFNIGKLTGSSKLTPMEYITIPAKAAMTVLKELANMVKHAVSALFHDMMGKATGDKKHQKLAESHNTQTLAYAKEAQISAKRTVEVIEKVAKGERGNAVENLGEELSVKTQKACIRMAIWLNKDFLL